MVLAKDMEIWEQKELVQMDKIKRLKAQMMLQNKGLFLQKKRTLFHQYMKLERTV